MRWRSLCGVLLAAGTLFAVAGCGSNCPPPPSCPVQPAPAPYTAPAYTAAPGAGAPSATAGPFAQSYPPGAASPGELALITQSLAAHIAKHDAAGCQDDLAKLRALDPALESTLVMYRAQCEMISGRCKDGAALLTQYFAQQTRLSAEQADRSVEQIAIMHCEEKQLSDRQRLMRAAQQLSQGAYIEDRTDCAENIAKVRALVKKVKPARPDDNTAANWEKSLFHTGANCYARTGNCTAAWKVFEAEYPKANLTKLDPAMRQKIMKQTFGSLVSRCKDTTLP